MPQKRPLTLIILDGFGHRADREGNAIALAQMPCYHELLEKYPHTLIQASGECVGLPKGVMGNSNVGHLCLGAGRVLRTDVERINHEIKIGEFFHNLRHRAAVCALLSNAGIFTYAVNLQAWRARRSRALHLVAMGHRE